MKANIKIVTPKREWLNVGEEYGTLYVVKEDWGDRYLVSLLNPDPNRFFQSTWTWSKDWLEEIDNIEVEI